MADPKKPDPKRLPDATGPAPEHGPEKGPAVNPPGAAAEKDLTTAPDAPKPPAGKPGDDRGPVSRLTTPSTPTGERGPEPGNVDDLSETRTPDMGKPPATGAGTSPRPRAGEVEDAGAEDELARLRRENARLKRALVAAVEEGEGPARFGATPEEVPGDGPVLWEGSMPTDKILGFSGPHGRPLKFRGPENEAEAREAFKKHAGIAHTEHKIHLRRVPDGD